jgi:D-glycero-alpha-D-manno-heptose-7-phosphate kinase
MIITRTPFRISFFGGGSDYHTWYTRHGGDVLSATIDKYCYITARWLPPFFPEKSRIVWSMIEAIKHNQDVQHTSVRAILKHLDIEDGIEIHHMGDLPARSGLGSSSAFTVGMLHAMRALKGLMSFKDDLADEAITIERDLLKENVGIQDQIAVAYGGFNHTTIDQSGDYHIEPLILHRKIIDKIQHYCLLFYTGVSRISSEVAFNQMQAHASGRTDKNMRAMVSLVPDAMRFLSQGNIESFADLLHVGWCLKRTLADNISNEEIDTMYEDARTAGAIGGKLLGAGGGGFMLIMARPEHHGRIIDALGKYLCVPFKFDNTGSTVVYAS